MSDAALRELERAWRASASAEDELRWHQARVRVGELEGWALELALSLRRPLVEPAPPGFLGRLLGRAAPEQGDRVRERVHATFATLAARSLEGYDRGLVACGELVLSRWHHVEPPRLLRRAVDELAARVLAPEAERDQPDGLPIGAPGWARCLALGLRERLSGSPPSIEWIDGTQFQPGYQPGPGYSVVRVGGPELPDGITDALARDLVPWLLRLADPLRARAERALDRVEVASPCPVAWDGMSGDERVRSCDQCRLQVYDLSALERDEAAALLRSREGERLCVRFYRRADGRTQTRDCPGPAAPLPTPHPRMGIVAPPPPPPHAPPRGDL